MIAGTSRRSSICCSKQPIPTVTVVYSMAWASAGIFFLLLLEKESPVEPDDAFSNPSQRVAENRNLRENSHPFTVTQHGTVEDGEVFTRKGEGPVKRVWKDA